MHHLWHKKIGCLNSLDTLKYLFEDGNALPTCDVMVVSLLEFKRKFISGLFLKNC
jgi:hypothetical protein